MYTYSYNPSLTGLNSGSIAAVQPQVLVNTASAPTPSATPHHSVYAPSSSAVSDPYIPPTRPSSHNPEQVKRRCLESSYQPPVTAKNLPPQQGIAQTLNTSPPNRVNVTSEGSGRAAKNDSGVLREECFSSSDDNHSKQKRTSTQNNTPLSQPPGYLYQQPYGLPIQTRQGSEAMQCLHHCLNKRIYGDIHYVTDYQTAGVGRGQIGHLPAKFRITFPEAFKALTKEQMMSMRVEGNLTLNQSKLFEYVQQTSEGTLNDLLFQKTKSARDIPVCLQATALIDEANRRITPEIQTITSHIQSLIGKQVTAGVLFFQPAHKGGIACHHDEASGIKTRFLFRLPEQFRDTPISELSNCYSTLQAKVTTTMSESALRSYVLELGSEYFMSSAKKGRINLFSDDVFLVPNESQQQ